MAYASGVVATESMYETQFAENVIPLLGSYFHSLHFTESTYVRTVVPRRTATS